MKREAMQPLYKITMFYAKHVIKVQAYQIFIKQNFLADILSCNQYIKLANKYSSLEIAQSTFGIPLKDCIQKSLLNKSPPNFSGMVWLLILGKHTQRQSTAIPNTMHYLVKELSPLLVGRLTSWIGYLVEKELKAKIIKGYLARL